MKNIFIMFACALGLCRARTGSLFDEELYRNVLDTELCAHQLQTMDASEFYESSFRVPQGLLTGNSISYGNYHKCLAIDQDFPGGNVKGKYCVIQAPLTTHIVRVPSLGGASESDNITWTEWNLKSAIATSRVTRPSTLRLGVCVPRACAVAALLRPYAEHPRVRFNYSEQFCRLPGDKPFHGADYIAIIIFSLLGLLTVASTAYELRYIFILKKDPATANELLRVCSLYCNTSRLLTFANKPRSLDCLEGIRAISVLWIIMLHTTITFLNDSVNKTEIINVDADKYLWVYTGPLAVDSFFVLSGLLLVYSTTYKNEQLSLKNLPLFYLNRYMRLFPVLATMVLVQASVMHRLTDSPGDFYYSTDKVGGCRTYWWSVLLHVQNLANPYNMCLMHSWYLSSDMQLYALSPLVLFWVLRARAPRAAWRALVAAVLVSLAATFAICFYFNFPHTDGFKFFSTEYKVTYLGWYSWYYIGTITRSPPFFIGMLFGYALHVYRNDKLRLPMWSVFLFYSLAAVFSFAVIFERHTSIGAFWDNQLTVNFKYALYRSFWAFSLCWLIFACANGYGGPVNWLLSLKPWQFVARISYAMYLSSAMIQNMPSGAGVNSYIDMRSLLWRYAGDVVWTVAFSVAVCVVVEAPIATLYRLMLNHVHSQQSTNKITNKLTVPIAKI